MTQVRVGELRPSQLLYTFGVGSVVDLPSISVMVMGLDDWAGRLPGHGRGAAPGGGPPAARPPGGGPGLPPRPADTAGRPVRANPWSACRSPRSPAGCSAPAAAASPPLQPIVLRPTPSARPQRTSTRTARAGAAPGGKPPPVPARFVVACEHGHLDDFPWMEFVHRGGPGCQELAARRDGGLRRGRRGAGECVACNSAGGWRTPSARGRPATLPGPTPAPAWYERGVHPPDCGRCCSVRPTYGFGGSRSGFASPTSVRRRSAGRRCLTHTQARRGSESVIDFAGPGELAAGDLDDPACGRLDRNHSQGTTEALGQTSGRRVATVLSGDPKRTGHDFRLREVDAHANLAT